MIIPCGLRVVYHRQTQQRRSGRYGCATTLESNFHLSKPLSMQDGAYVKQLSHLILCDHTATASRGSQGRGHTDSYYRVFFSGD